MNREPEEHQVEIGDIIYVRNIPFRIHQLLVVSGEAPRLTVNSILEEAIVQQEPISFHINCSNHKPVQHRDGQAPWCDRCGRDENGFLSTFGASG